MNARFFALAFAVTSAVTLSGSLMGCAVESGDNAGDESDDEVRSGKAGIATFVGQDGQFYFHLKGGNGEKILASEGYATKQAMQTGIDAVKLNGSKRANYEVRTAADGQAYLVLKAQNNEIIAVSETYASVSNAERARDRSARLFTNIKISEAPRVARFETFKSLVDNKYYFHLRAGNGEIVLQSEAYEALAGAKNGITATVEGVSELRFTSKTAADGRVYFVVSAANGEIVAVSETYSSAAAATKAKSRIVATIGQNLSPTVAAE
jgi:uncharacterized protein YegP (UPF0339 family)